MADPSQEARDLFNRIENERYDWSEPRTLALIDAALAKAKADALAAYELKVQDLAVETWVVSEVHRWASDTEHPNTEEYDGLHNVGVWRGMLNAKAEVLNLLVAARRAAEVRGGGDRG